MWESFLYWMGGATIWDWVWHIVAVVIALYLSVPGLWWPYVEKYMKKKEEREAIKQAELQTHAEASKGK
ncbi:hypothetical protein CIG75_08205 [Tumebacillus algifaecis]|uniref:Uncharacterized protein n=1 Tax=Tumebacillus algifaecis TaxID=1214604 RepID=A0A223D048_9BACL|nr:hypothetical protein [Tumebacillus algifaecis]ASS74970.1 hypothetical protein CIG75_08205 [Tumebacillus algifaecis]